MDYETRTKIYNAQVKNVAALASAYRQIKVTVNDSYRLNRSHVAKTNTKIAALVFRAWSEANFSKVIHTPYGLPLGDIPLIKAAAKRNLADGWKLCIRKGLNYVPNSAKVKYPNIETDLCGLVDTYVAHPSQIRNKIAHGQWIEALNSDNDDLNADLTREIDNLNIVQLDLWTECHKRLGDVVQRLIESPQRNFEESYVFNLVELLEDLEEKSTWTMESRLAALKRKPKPKKGRESPNET